MTKNSIELPITARFLKSRNAVRIVEALRDTPGRSIESLGALAELTGIELTTTSRLVKTLREEGVLVCEPMSGERGQRLKVSLAGWPIVLH